MMQRMHMLNTLHPTGPTHLHHMGVLVVTYCLTPRRHLSRWWLHTFLSHWCVDVRMTQRRVMSRISCAHQSRR
jgi:hypothetical protein